MRGILTGKRIRYNLEVKLGLPCFFWPGVV